MKESWRRRTLWLLSTLGLWGCVSSGPVLNQSVKIKTQTNATRLPAARGCTEEEYHRDECEDERLLVSHRLPNADIYTAVGVIDCPMNRGGTRSRRGSLVLVTTDRIENDPLKKYRIALTNAHIAYQPKSKRKKDLAMCELYFQKKTSRLQRNQLGFVMDAYENGVYNEERLRGGGDSLRKSENDWTVVLVKGVSKEVPSLNLEAYRGEASEIKTLSLVSFNEDFVDIAVSENCIARKGGNGAGVLRSPQMVGHFCDTMSGSSGGALFNGRDLVGIHVGFWGTKNKNSQKKGKNWLFDFDKAYNYGLLINEEMVEAVEEMAFAQKERE